MKLAPSSSRRLLGAILLLSVLTPAHAALLAGYGELSGEVAGSRSGVLAVVYAYNTGKNVGYTVFVVNGKYRAVDLIPGRYEITLRPAVGRLLGFPNQTVQRDVPPDKHVTANFRIGHVGPVPNYIGGMPYEACDRETPDCGAKILPYDKIFPPGPGRTILERTCLGCHEANDFSYNRVRGFPGGRPPLDKDGWRINVDRMHLRDPNSPAGVTSHFDARLLPPNDRDVLVDYLAANFGPESEPRVIQLQSEAPVDLKALERAMFVEYIYKEDPKKYPAWPWSHNLTFDGDGNVWNAYTGCCIVRTDPRTGESKAFEGNGGGSSVVVDRSDGSVWYSGDITTLNHGGSAPHSPTATVKHLDPKTGRVDYWLGQPSNTQIFDKQGNLWMSVGGDLEEWDRQANAMTRWNVPVLRSEPYGVIVDNDDKVWFAETFTDGVTRFDPDTEVFTHFPVTREAPTHIRRPGVDSKNMIWVATWASPRHTVNGQDRSGSLFRLNPNTGEVMERRIDFEYPAPYDANADSDDNIWVANDNYISKYDPKIDRFTHYPIPRRSDTLKTAISRDGAVWFVYRNGSKFAGYGCSSVALYPDKDHIRTLAAYFSDDSPAARSSKYQGPVRPRVTGALKAAFTARNSRSYEKWAIANGVPAIGTASGHGVTYRGASSADGDRE